MNIALTSILVLVLYFLALYLISRITSKDSTNETFFTANKSGKWYVVSFGMIGASLSGVTFLSVPGWVASNEMVYIQMVLGYILGYAIVAHVLLPVYYSMNLTSIYTYLNRRYGTFAYKTGAWFFLSSRIIGASFRLFLVAKVFQLLIFTPLGIPFYYGIAITILLIWIYTLKGGIKTIIWTDTLQTFFMLLAAGTTLWVILQEMNLSIPEAYRVMEENKLSTFFVWTDWKSSTFFLNQVFAGAFITIAMTGLDQDMMQKNLTLKTLKESQKNMWALSLSLLPVNALFLFLGGTLTVFALKHGLSVTGGDTLFSTVVYSGLLPEALGILFLLGLVAAAYSSADSALTSLTTSYCVDILRLKENNTGAVQTRKRVHFGMSVVLFIVISFAQLIDNDNVISRLFEFAGYTYGPLLGLFFFGLWTQRKVKDSHIPYIALVSPGLAIGLSTGLKWIGWIDLGFFLLILNGALCFALLWLASIFTEQQIETT